MASNRAAVLAKERWEEEHPEFAWRGGRGMENEGQSFPFDDEKNVIHESLDDCFTLDY